MSTLASPLEAFLLQRIVILTQLSVSWHTSCVNLLSSAHLQLQISS